MLDTTPRLQGGAALAETRRCRKPRRASVPRHRAAEAGSRAISAATRARASEAPAAPHLISRWPFERKSRRPGRRTCCKAALAASLQAGAEACGGAPGVWGGAPLPPFHSALGLCRPGAKSAPRANARGLSTLEWARAPTTQAGLRGEHGFRLCFGAMRRDSRGRQLARRKLGGRAEDASTHAGINARARTRTGAGGGHGTRAGHSRGGGSDGHFSPPWSRCMRRRARRQGARARIGGRATPSRKEGSSGGGGMGRQLRLAHERGAASLPAGAGAVYHSHPSLTAASPEPSPFRRGPWVSSKGSTPSIQAPYMPSLR